MENVCNYEIKIFVYVAYVYAVVSDRIRRSCTGVVLECSQWSTTDCHEQSQRRADRSSGQRAARDPESDRFDSLTTPEYGVFDMRKVITLTCGSTNIFNRWTMP
ncbi:hypothetical protein EVAR_49380_1 [Eumeta japonica]|uniref:Uncharacterized protein n=1 Tax=Eumeta variegata TaxID=151549 RepID=A0A4C1YQI7_EUMVA|nr:hypothetical protein EVAR_49380_1 [Eumeta japonica]